jgi:WD40 repeat protein
MPKNTSIFISYSTRDRPIANEVKSRLERRGFPAPFIDYHPEDGIPAGQNWERDIYRRIKQAGGIVFVGTKKSVASKWCFAELALARSMDKPIFALRVEPGVKQPLLDDGQWTDFGTDRKTAYARLFRGMKEFGLDPHESFNWNGQRSPYPGLAAFDELDAAVFFGRDEESETLFQRVNNSHLEGGERFITVIGASGSGKSSLVRAGLIPRLRRLGAPWLVVEPMVPSTEPLEMLARSLAKTHRSLGGKLDWTDMLSTLRAPGRGLVSAARDVLDVASGEHRVALVFVDQAEELVTLASDESRAEFARVIRDALDGPDVIRVVATLRSEFLTSALQQTELAKFIEEPFLLAPLDRGRLASVIAGPADVAAIDVAPGLVERIVDDTGGGDALPLMSFTMERLYRQMARRKRQALTESDYRDVGGVSGALDQRANEIQAKLDRAGLKAKVVPTLLKLVSLETGNLPTRRRLPVAALSKDERKIIRAFEDGRLTSTDGAGDSAVVFVSHEAFFRTWSPLADAIEANLEELRERSRIERDARDWIDADRNEAYLLRGERLDRALHWRTHDDAVDSEPVVVREFIDASRDLRDRMVAREADLLANRIIKDHRDDPERAMLVLMSAVAAYGNRPRLQLALSYAVLAPGVRLRFDSERALECIALSPDGTLAAMGGANGLVMMKDEVGDVQWEVSIGDAPISADRWRRDSVCGLAFGGSGQFLGAVRRGEQRVYLLDPSSGDIIHTLDTDAEVSAIDCSEMLVVATAGGALYVWSATAPYPLLSKVSISPEPLRQVQIAAQEERLVLASPRSVYFVDVPFEMRYSQKPTALQSSMLVAEASREDDIRAVAISPDGRLVAVAVSSRATAWGIPESSDRKKGVSPALRRRIDVEKVLHCVGWTTDRRMITGDWARGLRAWDIDTGAESGGLVPENVKGTVVAFSHDDARIATIDEGKHVTVVHVREHGPRLRVRIGNAFSQARFAGGDEFLITRSGGVLGDSRVILRNARTGAEINHVNTTSPTSDDITVSPDGTMVAINEDSGVVIRSVPDLRELRSLPIEGINHVVFDRSGIHRIVTANFDGDIQAWTSDQPVTLGNVGEFYAGSLDLTPDGRCVLVAAGRRVVLLDLTTGREVFEEAIDDTGDVHAAVAPDGRCVVVGQNYHLRTLNLDGSPRTTFAWDSYNRETNWNGGVARLAFAPDSTRLATASNEGWIYIWDVETGELLQLMRVDDEPLKDLAFSQSGQDIVTCTATFEGEYDSTGYAEIWPAPDMRHLLSLAERRTFRAITPEELAQYGLSEANATGSAASVFHLSRRSR